MLIWYAGAGYLVGLALWIALLAAALLGLVMMRRRAKGRRWLALSLNAGLSVWMLCACVTAIEVVFAMFWSESDALNFTNVGRRWYAVHVAPQINELGLRTRHSPQRMLAAEPARIAFVGDSFVFGHGVAAMEDRFTDRVETALEKAVPGRWEVDNLGVPGHDVQGVLQQVRLLAANGYHPKIWVYVWQVNDLEQLDERTWRAAAGLSAARSESWIVADTYFVNWLWYRMALASSGVSTYFDDLRAAYDGPAFDRAAAVLDDLRAVCSEHGGELRLVVFPFLHDIGDDYSFRNAHRRLAEWAQQRGVPLLDLEPVLSAHAAERLVVGSRDTHPNERAHQLAADAMRTGLLADVFAGNGGR